MAEITWEQLVTATTGNEASVEFALVGPLLRLLGYDDADIAVQHPCFVQEGRAKRPKRADFAVFNGKSREKGRALLVVEAKRPGESLVAARDQAESYAANLGAPLFLTIDGMALEIWQMQPSFESRRVAAFSVSQILQRRGLIESTLSKPAAIAWKDSLMPGHVERRAVDLAPYLTASRENLAKHPVYVKRALKRDQRTVSVQEFFAAASGGAVIEASSGLGKTTLTRELFDAVDQGLVPSHKAPVIVNLPDAALDRDGLLTFVGKRLAAHVPTITQSVFQDILRVNGMVLICDALDRVPLGSRSALGSELRTLVNDYPKLCLVVLSRRGVAFDIGLPKYVLQELSVDQQKELIAQRMGGMMHAGALYSALRGPLQRLTGHPLLLDLMVKHQMKNGRLPRSLAELFEAWIDSLLRSDPERPSRKIQARQGLELIAQESRDSIAVQTAVLKRFSESGLSQDVYDELLVSEAIVQESRSVEVCHEALADYLRATRISEDETLLKTEIERLNLSGDSLLPVLLISLTGKSPLYGDLWKAVETLDLEQCLHCIRFRSELSEELSAWPIEKASLEVVRDFDWGLQGLAAKFFPALREQIVRQHTQRLNPHMKLIGGLSARRDEIVLGFLPTEAEAEAEAETPEGLEAEVLNGVNSMTFRVADDYHNLDSGRYLGAHELRKALKQVVARRGLRGGKTWTEERLGSRLRYLEQKFWRTAPRTYPLEELEQRLTPDRANVVRIDTERWFFISEMMDDIRALRDWGATEFVPWWLRFVDSSTLRPLSDEATASLFDIHYKRAVQAYTEVCRESFPGLLHRFSMLHAVPMRWHITVSRSGTETYVFSEWRPVDPSTSIGADVEWSKRRRIISDPTDTAVYDELVRLGRHVGGYLSLEKSMYMPMFHSNDRVGCVREDSSVLVEACGWVLNDIGALFHDLHERE